MLAAGQRVADPAAEDPRAAEGGEGFYKYEHKPFAASLRIARGELGEASESLDEALQKGYISADEFKELEGLCGKALAANAGLLNYLDGNSTR